MAYQKNDLIELEIGDIGSDGEGIGKTGAFTWFIKDAVPGDTVRAIVLKTKKNYGFARLKDILKPSSDRIVPACPIARQCGGCSLQTMNYEAQLRYKEDKVRNDLKRIGGLQLSEEDAANAETPAAVLHPIIGAEQTFRYRNKAQYPVGKDRNGNTVAGFYAGRTHSIIPCGDCLLGPEENRDILSTVMTWMQTFHIEPYAEETQTGLVRHVLIRKGFRTGEIMACLVVNGKNVPHADELCGALMKIAGMKTVVLNINRKDTNVILGDRSVALTGPGYITDMIGDVRFRISAQSFFQVNPVQTEKLYNTALRYAGLTGNETVWDLYCGIGTISLFLAQKAKKVCGVEIVPQAIADARENAERNGISNAEFFIGKAEEILPEQFAKNGATADVIVVDPPRKGCDEACLNVILKMKPSKIVYVSCDPATLARDLKILTAGGFYAICDVQPVDMFAETVHVETVVLMSRVKD